jgi:selenocysteine lyase/cysteine desulfurase
MMAREFPRLQDDRAVYLNSASTGPLAERTVKALQAFNELRAEPWKISQEYQFGVVDRSRDLLAQLINADAGEIALMTNTSYGLNFAATSLPLKPGDAIVYSDRDFPSNVYPWMAAEQTRGVTSHRVPCAGRLFNEDALLAALDAPNVKVLAVSWVSFESGVALDLTRLGKSCRERGIYFVVDAIQGLGPLTLDVSRTPIDILSCGAQKWLLSPWGTGFMYVRKELVPELMPSQVGWMSVVGSDDFSQLLNYNLAYREDARRFEVVTLPFQDFAGMNASLELLHAIGPDVVASRIQQSTRRIIQWAHSRRDVTLVTPSADERRAGIVAFIPPDAARASRILTAAGVAHSLREGAIRLSPHVFTPTRHIDRALAVLES